MKHPRFGWDTGDGSGAFPQQAFSMRTSRTRLKIQAQLTENLFLEQTVAHCFHFARKISIPTCRDLKSGQWYRRGRNGTIIRGTHAPRPGTMAFDDSICDLYPRPVEVTVICEFPTCFRQVFQQ